MKDIVEAQPLDEGRCLFAANTACAEHGDLLAFQLVAVLLDPFGELAKSLGLRIKRPFECADGIFIIVARIDHDGVLIGDECVPVLRRDIGADAFQRIDTIDTHGDDLTLQPHLHAMERHFGRMGIFELRVSQTGDSRDVLHQLFNCLGCACNRPIDAFRRQKQRSLDAIRAAKLGKRLAQAFILRERRKAIKGGNGERQIAHRFYLL